MKINFGMNWISLFGAIIVILLLIPNIVYAWKRLGAENLCKNRFMNLLEQIGRYCSMLFMVFYFGEGDGFGVSSVQAFLCYAFGSLALLASYWIVWIVYFRMAGVHVFTKSREPSAAFVAGRREVSRVTSLKWALAILPFGLFLLCGITLWYIPLTLSAVVFGIGHIYVTHANIADAMIKGDAWPKKDGD